MKEIVVSFFLLCAMHIQAQTIDESYAAYDFQPGEKTIFEDKFLYATNENIADHWDFMDGGGAASLRMVDSEMVLSFDAFYTRLKPKIFGNKPLPDDFTIEYDAWLDESYDSNPSVCITFELANGTRLPMIIPSRDRLSVILPNNETVSKENPEEYYSSKFWNRWIHFSISVHQKKMKVFLDQNFMIEINDILEKPIYLIVYGDKIGEPSNGQMPIYLKNFRLATGFPINIFENGKFITRNIKFDVNKSILKPESISTIKQVKDYLDKNTSVKLEINGHTDSDGTDADNLVLSQKRADAVLNQLISMGIDASRLTAKGFGESQPIDKNTTLEAKSNNRRVEFVIVK